MLSHLLTAAATTHRTPRAAWVLGLMNVSLLPWFAAAVWFAEDTGLWVRLSIAYEALTLGFLGGVRCGFAFAAKDRLATQSDYATAITLPLVGWIALIPQPLAGGAILMAGFLMSALWDVAGVRSGALPAWYGRLRLQFLAPMIVFLAIVMARIVAVDGPFGAG